MIFFMILTLKFDLYVIVIGQGQPAFFCKHRLKDPQCNWRLLVKHYIYDFKAVVIKINSYSRSNNYITYSILGVGGGGLKAYIWYVLRNSTTVYQKCFFFLILYHAYRNWYVNSINKKFQFPRSLTLMSFWST